MTPLGPSARDIIDAAEGTDLPAPSDKDRMRARLAASIGASIVGGAVAGAAVKSVSASTTATAMLKGATGGAAGTTLLAKILAGAMVASALTVGYVAGRRSDVEATRAPSSADPPAPASGRAPSTTTTIMTPPSASPAAPSTVEETTAVATSRVPAGASVVGQKPAPASVRATDVAPPAPAAASAPPINESTEGEAALLQRARTAIDAGDGVTALDALDAGDRRFPSGMLGDQRQAERIIAMCTIARVPLTKERAERFLADRPRSQQAERIRKACGVP